MIKWPIKYVDYNGNTITENFYFHLNKAELVKMQFEANGGYSQFIERVTNQRDLKALGDEFERIVLNAYGEKSDDGRTFRKSEKLKDDFKHSEAYSELFMELITDSDKAVSFIKGILPKELQDVNPEDLALANMA